MTPFVLDSEEQKKLIYSLVEEYMSYQAKINSTKEDNFIPILLPGQKLCTSTPNVIRTFIVSSDGDVDPLTSSPYVVEEIKPQVEIERTMAQVISFDNNSVIARVYFESHHSTRKFKKLFVERLKEKDLLYENAYFNIVTKKNEDGSLNFDIEDCDDFSDPDIANMYGEIFKD